MDKRIRYIGGYKYQLAEGYTQETAICPPNDIHTPFIRLTTDGYLMIAAGYAWDGATRAADTKNLMRATLVHDALYQLMRHEHLSRAHQHDADALFYQLMREDGVFTLRAYWIYLAVTFFGNAYTDPKNKRLIEVAP